MEQSSGQQLLRRAALKTMRGTAQARITRRSAPDDGFSGVVLTGVVDFDNDRCELRGENEHLVLIGSTGYDLLKDGRWLRTQGEVGQRNPFDPHLLLGLLARGAGAVERIAGNRYAVAVNSAARSAAQFTPIAGSLKVGLEVTLDDEQRVKGLTEVMRDDQGGFMVEVATVLVRREHVSAICEPPKDQVVTLESLLAEG